MSEKDRGQDAARDGAERSEAESRAAPRPLVPEGTAAVSLPPPGTPGKSYTPAEKVSALRAYSASGERMREWCAGRGISTATLCAWRRSDEKGGMGALAPRHNPRNSRRVRAHARRCGTDASYRHTVARIVDLVVRRSLPASVRAVISSA